MLSVSLNPTQQRTATRRLRPFIQASAHRAYMSAPVSCGGQRWARSARSTSFASANFRVNASRTLRFDDASSAGRGTLVSRQADATLRCDGDRESAC